MGNKFSKKKLKKSGYLETLSSYHFEKKEDFIEKEHLVHVFFKELFQTNFCSPIKNILSDPKAKILDVGCGSGFWLMEMSADFPKPSYVGVDVVPIFPKSTFPNNIKFFQLDFLKGLPFDNNTFDFIYVRSLAYEFTESQWETFVYQELARLLKPGGWLEIWDYNMELVDSGPTLNQINSAIRKNLTSNNISPYIIQRYHSLIESTPSFFSSIIYHEKRALSCHYHDSEEKKLEKIGAQIIKEVCRCAYLGPIGQNMNIKRENIGSKLDMIEREFELYKSCFYTHGFYVQKNY